MNPILLLWFSDDDDKDSAVLSPSGAVVVVDDDAEQLPVNHCYEVDAEEGNNTRIVDDCIDELEQRNDSSCPERPPSDSSSLSLTNEKSDPNQEFIEKKVKKINGVMDPKNASASSSGVVPSSSPLPPTHLSRQNIVRALQPGAFHVTSTRVSRVAARHNRPNHNRSMDANDSESNVCGSSGNDAESTPVEDDCRTSPGPIEAQLVPSPSMAWQEIPRAEVIEPMDPTLVTKDLEEQEKERQQRQQQPCTTKFLGRRSGAKLIILSIGLVIAVSVAYLLLRKFYYPSSSTTMESLPYCSEEMIKSACSDMEKQNDATHSKSHDTEVKDLLRSTYKCKIDTEFEICSRDDGNHDDGQKGAGHPSARDLCPYVTDETIDQCPNMALNDICNAILDYVGNVEIWPSESGYTEGCAVIIAIQCEETDHLTICDVWDEVLASPSSD
jgi:hypothetical protein